MPRRRRKKVVDTQTYIMLVETDEKGSQWISVMLPTGEIVKMFDNELRSEACHVRIVDAVTSMNSHNIREIESLDAEADLEFTNAMYQDAGWTEKQIKQKDIKVTRIMLVDF